MKTHVMVRFGRWQEIIDEPLPDDPTISGLDRDASLRQRRRSRYAQAFRAADESARHFHDSLERIPSQRRFFNNRATAYWRWARRCWTANWNITRAIMTRLMPICGKRQRDDNLEYIEPWAWMHPPRHALAALLAEQGHYDEAEQVYRDDLGLERQNSTCRSTRTMSGRCMAWWRCLRKPRTKPRNCRPCKLSSRVRWPSPMCR